MSKTVKRVVYITAFSLLNSFINFFFQILIANFYGANSGTDVYFVAFSIPEWIMNVTMMILPISVIPSFTKVREEKGEKEAWRLIHVFFTYFSVVLSVLVIGIAIFADQFAPLMVNNPGTYPIDQLAFHLRVMIPSVLFNNLTWILNGVSMANDRYLVPALSPVLQSLVMVAAILLGRSTLGINAASLGVLLGSIIQFVVVSLSMPKPGAKLNFKLQRSGIGAILSLFLPLFLGNVILKSEVFINRYLATFLSIGSVTYFFFGSRIIRLLVRMTSKGIATLAFTKQSAQHASGDLEGFKETFNKNFQIILYLACLIAVLLTAGGKELVQIFFLRGEFDQSAVDQTYMATIALLGVLVAFPLGDILNNTFSSLHKTSIITYVNLGLFVPVIFLRLILQSSFGLVGLGIGSSVGALLSSSILLVVLQRKFNIVNSSQLGKSVLKIALTAGISLGVLFGLNHIIIALQIDSIFLVYLAAFIRVVLVAGVFLIGLFLLDRSFKDQILSRLLKARTG